MNRRSLMLACAALIAAGGPSSARAQCTNESETGRRLVLAYATQYTNARPAGVPVVSSAQVRPLTNPTDSAVCQQLFYVWWAQWQNPEEPKPGWHWTYYKVGDLYYVVVHKTTPAVTQNADGTVSVSLSWTPIFILDANYSLIASVAR